MIVGMSQTQPTADGQAGNADKLQLVVRAGVAQIVMLHAFAVAPIPTATKFKWQDFIWGSNNGKYKWTWGNLDKITFISDGGALKGVYASEQIKTVEQTGTLKDLKSTDSEGDWQDVTKGTWNDVVGLTFSAAKVTREKALGLLIWAANQKKDSHMTKQQVTRYYVSAIEKKPAKVTDAHVVNESGYELSLVMYPGKEYGYEDDYIIVGRYPKAVLGAQKGLVDDDKGWYAYYCNLV